MKKDSAIIIAALTVVISLSISCTRTVNFYDLKELGSVKNKSSHEIKDNYWGIQASTLDPVMLEKMTDIGVKWTRLGASWSSIEKKKGAYNWKNTDEAFQAMTEASIIPFVTLGGANRLYSERKTYDDPKLAEIYGYSTEPPTENEAAMKGWLKFVEATVTRYKDKIIYWEIWNEPNHRNYWGAKPNATDYGRLVFETARIIKSIQPDAKIIAGAMAGLNPKFIDGFLANGVHEYVDIISYHNYGAIPETRIYRAYEAWEVIDRYKPEIEMWQGECGYPSHSSSRDYRGISPWGLNIQSKWLLRQAFTDIYFCKASMSNYFKLIHDRGFGEIVKRSYLSPVDSILGYPERNGSRVKTKGVNEKCLLANPDFEPKPAYYVYRNLCAVMDKSFKPIKMDHKLTVLNDAPFYGIGKFDDAFPSQTLVAKFKNNKDQYMIAYWLPWHPQEFIEFPARIELELDGIDFADPVIIDLLDGKVYQLEDLNNLPLMDYPLIITERAAVDIS